MLELREEISDKIEEAFSSMNEEIDEQITKISNLTSLTESYYNILDLAGRKALGVDNELMNKIK
jgi:hypothetical protein